MQRGSVLCERDDPIGESLDVDEVHRGDILPMDAFAAPMTSFATSSSPVISARDLSASSLSVDLSLIASASLMR